MSELATVEVREVAGTPLLRISGEIDLSNAADVMGAVGREVSASWQEVLIDLSGVRFLDSSGIAMLFRLSERLAHGRQDLRLVVPPDSPIRAVLEITRLEQVIPVLDSISAGSAETTGPAST